VFYKFIILILFLFIGCATVKQELNPKTYYKRNMKLKYAGKTYHGVGILPKADVYKFVFESWGKMDEFSFSTLHRYETMEDARKGKIFPNKRKVEFVFKPTIETVGRNTCVIRADSASVKGKHSFGNFIIKSDDAMLPAIISCNGTIKKEIGISMCQSKLGLIQVIEFKTPVVFSPEFSGEINQECVKIKYEVENNKKFTYRLPRRECVFEFMEVAPPGRIHKMFTIGFEEVIRRER